MLKMAVGMALVITEVTGNKKARFTGLSYHCWSLVGIELVEAEGNMYSFIDDFDIYIRHILKLLSKSNSHVIGGIMSGVFLRKHKKKHYGIRVHVLVMA